ncbi:sulfite oxidase [Dactylosporangium sp. AC04546]|uniref:sulfite oxidase n=1 Tax=Dactylosporangium sp. AC04546 TaxID=2862460 RepID=UPI001EDEAB4C|nr:sulfite oxidase [Dactylosporangium sp. AC04546]WVK88966.1 sulfite oxidase [Dactylosporangium sp. AC04546]
MWDKRNDMIVYETEPFNAEPPPTALAGQPLTPIDTFYSRNHGPTPDIDASTWRLHVDGLVDRQLDLSLAELRQLPVQTVVATLECAGNRRAELNAVRPISGQEPWGPATISTAEWTGVRLADVLAAARPRAGAAHIAFAAPDIARNASPPQPYGASIPLSKASSGEVLLAWSMNGRPLPRVHGGPVRVVVPGYIGARSVKWVHRITAQPEPSDNYFQATAYRLLPSDGIRGPGRGIPLGPAILNAAILAPGNGAAVAAGPTSVTGYAFSGEHTVARVDVSPDGGQTWSQATLAQPASPWTWQLWHTTLSLPGGPALITARAWDDTGATQPEQPATVWNPEGYANTAWPRVQVDVRSPVR